MQWWCMDPFIDPEALDPAHPLFARKIANLRLGEAAHERRDEFVAALPVKVTLQTTDACNLNCPHCQIPAIAKNRHMPWEVAQRVVDELFPTLVELHPTNLGEPFAWPPFERLCGEMARHGVVLDLTTNGTLLDGRRLEFVLPILRDLKVSFDGAKASTFERLRRGASFEAVCANVRAASRALEAERRRGIVVALQMTIMRSNFRELPDLVRLAADLGAQRVKAYHLFSLGPELDSESIVGEREEWNATLDETMSVAASLGVNLQLAEPWKEGAVAYELERIACHLPWHESWIDFDGAVLPCHSHGGDVAGNVLEAPFEAAWNGPLYRQIRSAFAADRPGWHCEGCGMCWRKSTEHQPVPYDPDSFLSRQGRLTAPTVGEDVRWSGRMRPFDLDGRR